MIGVACWQNSSGQGAKREWVDVSKPGDGCVGVQEAAKSISPDSA